jgi:hypothetical protein
MKMNSLDALIDLLQKLDGPAEALLPFAPRTYPEKLDGQPLAALATRTIVRMRDFQREGQLSPELIAALQSAP